MNTLGAWPADSSVYKEMDAREDEIASDLQTTPSLPTHTRPPSLSSIYASHMKRAREDPSYDLVQWAMRNKHSLFRHFFVHHTDISPLTCEMQYAVRQISGAAPKRLYSGGKFNGVHLAQLCRPHCPYIPQEDRGI